MYFGAARVWTAGGALYSAQLATPIRGFHLGFTYPPAAAELFALLSWLPIRVGAAALTALSAAALFLASLLSIGSMGRADVGRFTRYPVPLLAAGATWLACTLEPVRQTFSFGQINLVLLGLVTADCLVATPWWPRGALVGSPPPCRLRTWSAARPCVPRWRTLSPNCAAGVGAPARKADPDPPRRRRAGTDHLCRSLRPRLPLLGRRCHLRRRAGALRRPGSRPALRPRRSAGPGGEPREPAQVDLGFRVGLQVYRW